MPPLFLSADSTKNLEEICKKCLTNGGVSVIISKLSARAASQTETNEKNFEKS